MFIYEVHSCSIKFPSVQECDAREDAQRFAAGLTQIKTPSIKNDGWGFL